MISSKAVSSAKQGLFVIAGPTDDISEGLGIVGDIATSALPVRRVLDFRGRKWSEIDGAARLADGALVFLDITDGEDARFAVDLSRNAAVVAMLHARPAPMQVGARLSLLLGRSTSIADNDWQLIETRRGLELAAAGRPHN